MASSTLLSLSGSLLNSTTFQQTVSALLVYGGQSSAGGSAPPKVKNGATDTTSTLRAAMTTCDTTGSLTTSFISTFATCVYPKITTGSAPAGATGRRLAAVGALAADDLVQDDVSSYASWSSSSSSLADYELASVASPPTQWRRREMEAAGQCVCPGDDEWEGVVRSRRSLQTTSSVVTFHNEPVLGVFQSQYGQRVQSRRQGAWARSLPVRDACRSRARAFINRSHSHPRALSFTQARPCSGSRS